MPMPYSLTWKCCLFDQHMSFLWSRSIKFISEITNHLLHSLRHAVDLENDMKKFSFVKSYTS